MAEIGRTTHIPRWPVSRVVRSAGDASQSPEKQAQKDTAEEDENSRPSGKINKKKPPGNNMNPHIDEYA